MSNVVVSELIDYQTQENIPITRLNHRVIRKYINDYKAGSWVPSISSYQWMPGGYVDYTPASSLSRIRFNIRIAYAHTNGHSICHCIFYAANSEVSRHCISGQSPEHRHSYIWDIESWGTAEQRIGYQMRSYGSSNQPRINGTHHWNASGSDQAAHTQIVLEEYIPIS